MRKCFPPVSWLFSRAEKHKSHEWNEWTFGLQDPGKQPTNRWKTFEHGKNWVNLEKNENRLLFLTKSLFSIIKKLLATSVFLLVTSVFREQFSVKKWSFVDLRATGERPENYFCMKMLVFWCFWGEIEIFLVKSRQGVCKSRPKVEICNPWQDFTRKIEISPQSHQKSSIWMQKYVLWLSKVVCNTTENFVA